MSEEYWSPETYAWRYNEVSFKASHNSYAREERPVTNQIPWNSRSNHQEGCRGLELDLMLSRNVWVWSITHDGDYDVSADRQFSEYLIVLRDWSTMHPDHDVMTVTLDLKSNPYDQPLFPLHLDAYIDRYLGAERMFVPQELQGSENSLVRGAMRHGWPTLGELQGKFILCLSGREEAKAMYASSGKERLCFADKEIQQEDDRPSTISGHRVFFNFDWMLDWGAWTEMNEWMAGQPGFVTRGYLLNFPDLWNRALAAKVNILATDKVRDHKFAKVGPLPFRRF